MNVGPADTQRFVETLGRSGVFSPGEPVHVARAPGRLDVMGGIADYSGALVLQMPIAEAAHVALQRTDDPKLHLISDDGQQQRRLQFDPAMLDYEPDQLRRTLAGETHEQWAAYVLGPMLMLLGHQQMSWRGGMNVLIRSDVPEGKGVSSSAALEVATMRAAASALCIALDGPTVAQLCQQAENQVAGAPCGIMDQMTSACGRPDCLLMLLCQPATIQGHLPLPEQLAVWGIDSGIRHAVGGSDYTTVRTGAAMGFRMIADLLGGDEPPLGGYLANIPPSLFAERLADHLPASLTGRDFLAGHGPIFDPVVQVEPDRSYPVLAPTAHPVFEQHRLHCFAKLLSQGDDPAVARLLGEMMYQSHASYGRCGLGSNGTDMLVQRIRDAGPDTGLYGARITGGGSGGTVAILARADAGPAIERIAQNYAEYTDKPSRVFTGSSHGAMQTPVQILR